MKVFHWSAVNPENPSPVAILFGILLISDGTFILLARSCMISKCFVVNRFSSIHNWVTIHLAIPKNRQCIGSTIRNFVGSKCSIKESLDPGLVLLPTEFEIGNIMEKANKNY